MWHEDEEGENAEVDAQLLNETIDAFLIRLDEDCKETWIPKTLVVSYHTNQVSAAETIICLELPEWLALKEGLI